MIFLSLREPLRNQFVSVNYEKHSLMCQIPRIWCQRSRIYLSCCMVLFAYTISRDEVKSGKHSHGYASTPHQTHRRLLLHFTAPEKRIISKDGRISGRLLRSSSSPIMLPSTTSVRTEHTGETARDFVVHPLGIRSWIGERGCRLQ